MGRNDGKVYLDLETSEECVDGGVFVRGFDRGGACACLGWLALGGGSFVLGVSPDG